MGKRRYADVTAVSQSSPQMSDARSQPEYSLPHLQHFPFNSTIVASSAQSQQQEQKWSESIQGSEVNPDQVVEDT